LNSVQEGNAGMGEDGRSGFAVETPAMLAGASAGVVARLLCHPVDTIKAKLQVSTERGAHGSFTGLARKVYVTEGVPGLYRGIGVAFFGSAPAACLYFAGYEAMRDYLRGRGELKGTPFVADFVAGFVAECVSCVLWVPIDVSKQRLQVQSSLKGAVVYRGSADAIARIVREEGVLGLYRGYGATLLAFGPFSACYFLFYERLKHLTSTPQQVRGEAPLSSVQAFLNGSGAGAASSVLTNGLDVARLRIQVQRADHPHPRAQGASVGHVGETFHYRGFFQALASIVRHEGFSALFKGAMARVIFTVPNQAVSIMLFESFKNFYQGLGF